MTKFLKRLSFFTLLLVAYLGANFVVNKYFLSEKNPVQSESFGILVLGDSHTRRSVNPKFLENSINISQASEPYLVSYWKLQRILKFQKLDTVILAFAPHNLSEFNDRKFSDAKWSSEMFTRTYLIGNTEDIEPIGYDENEYYRASFSNMFLFPKTSHRSFIGDFENSNKNEPIDADKVIGRHFYHNGEELSVSSFSIETLEKIIALCKTNGVHLILLSPPVHPSYYNRIPKDVLKKYYELSRDLKMKGIPIIDETNQYYDNKYYLNSDHLNKSGAELFTKSLVSKLK